MFSLNYILVNVILILMVQHIKALTKLSDLTCSLNKNPNANEKTNETGLSSLLLLSNINDDLNDRLLWELIRVDPVSFADRISTDESQLMIQLKETNKYLCANLNNKHKLTLMPNRIAKILSGCKWSLTKRSNHKLNIRNELYLTNNVDFQNALATNDFDNDININQFQRYRSNQYQKRLRSRRLVQFWHTLSKPAKHDDIDWILECMNNNFESTAIYIKF